MKRFFMTLGVALLANSVTFAAESTLIDFAKLIPDANLGKHAPTVIDYSKQAGTSYTAADKAAMKTSLAIGEWEIELASSARTVENQSLSQVKAAKVSAQASKYADETVMGVRVHFPTFGINSWAMIKPPFDIPAYSTLTNDDGSPADQAAIGKQFDGFGVLKNVGVIKAIQINIMGRNYPNGLSLVLEDQNGVEQQIFMGYLNFDGWKALQWNNPNYQKEVRNREIVINPLYPKSEPFTKLKGIIIHRDGSREGGDFVSYFKDIKVIYDVAALERSEEVDDEGVWGILKEREEQRRNSELARLGNVQVLRKLEEKKMATQSNFDQPASATDASTTAQ